MGDGSSGESLGNGNDNKNIKILNSDDVWSYRHKAKNEPFVDAINTAIRSIQDDFGDVMETVTEVSASKFGGADGAMCLGCWALDDKSLHINKKFTSIPIMNATYDASVKTGFHPGRGNRTGTEAVTLHEMGHALADHIGAKLHCRDNDTASKRIVNEAYKASGARGGTKRFAGKISGYAQESYAECVAEAVSDFYCNGSKASDSSKAIVSVMKKYR